MYNHKVTIENREITTITDVAEYDLIGEIIS